MGENQMLERLFEQVTGKSQLCDVCLKCEDGDLVAHKSVLVAASPVFEAMLTTRFKEAKSNEVNIEFPSSVMASILKHIYTGKLETNMDDVWQVYEFAHRNDLSELMTACLNFISLNLDDSGNAVRSYVYGLVYDIEKAVYAGMKYIAENLPDVSKTDEFGALDYDKVVNIILNNARNHGDNLEAIINWIMQDPSDRYDKHYRDSLDFVSLNRIPDDRFIAFASHQFYAERQADWNFLVKRRLAYAKRT